MSGLESFQRRLNAIPKRAREAVGPALVRAAESVADVQRSLAPVRTGALRASIVVTGPGQAVPAYSQGGVDGVVGELSAAITVGNTEVRYGHVLEYGSTDTRPQPFFWPGWRLMRKKARTAIKRAIGRAIRSA